MVIDMGMVEISEEVTLITPAARAGSPEACEGPACSQEWEEKVVRASGWVFLLPSFSPSVKTLSTASDKIPTPISLIKTNLNWLK